MGLLGYSGSLLGCFYAVPRVSRKVMFSVCCYGIASLFWVVARAFLRVLWMLLVILSKPAAPLQTHALRNHRQTPVSLQHISL